MTQTNIAITRQGYRRNVTLALPPTAQEIDLLVRTGHTYDEKAQQWWKWERGGEAIAAAEFFARLDAEEKTIREVLNLSGPERDDHRLRYQSYYTPEGIAEELVKVAEVQPGHSCLEPSAGHGAILIELIQAGGLVTAVEADPEAFEEIEEHCEARFGDFLAMNDLGSFDRIVMNPPFSRDQDTRHVMHAFKFLKPGGQLVAIVGSYALNGKTDDRERFGHLMRECGRVVRELPPGTFDNNARAVIVELRKHERV